MLIPQIKLIANFPKQHILFCYVTIMRRTFRLRTPLVQRQATLQGPHWRCSWPHRCLGHSSTTASWVKKTLLYIFYIWDYMGLYGLYMGYIWVIHIYIYMYGIFPLIYGIYIYMEYPEFFFMDYPHWIWDKIWPENIRKPVSDWISWRQKWGCFMGNFREEWGCLKEIKYWM